MVKEIGKGQTHRSEDRSDKYQKRAFFDRRQKGLLRLDCFHVCFICPRRLARPRTSPFHGGNTGSNPVGDAKLLNNLQELKFWRATLIDGHSGIAAENPTD